MGVSIPWAERKRSRRITAPDQAHLHFRFLRRGYSERRATVYIWAWCTTLAAAALGERFLTPHRHGEWHLWRTLGTAGLLALALAASLYTVYLLAIVKLSNPWIRRREEQARLRKIA